MTKVVRGAWHWLGSPGAFRAVQLIIVLQLGFVGILGYEQSRQTKCQAAYNRAAAARTGALNDAVAESRRTLATMVKASLTRDQGATYVAAANAFLQAQAREEEQRKRNPIPAPDDYCGH